MNAPLAPWQQRALQPVVERFNRVKGLELLLHGLPLRRIGDEAVLVDGLPVGGQGRDDIQRVHGRGFPCCSGRVAGDSRGDTGVAAAPQCTASHTVGCPAAVASTRWRTPAGISR